MAGQRRSTLAGLTATPDVGDVMLDVCRSIDDLVQLIRPRVFLFMAIDGVAPRAKVWAFAAHSRAPATSGVCQPRFVHAHCWVAVCNR